MAPRYGLLHNVSLRRSEIFCGIQDLLGCRDVVVCTRQQIGGASDVVEIELPSQPDEFALGKPVPLKIWVIA